MRLMVTKIKSTDNYISLFLKNRVNIIKIEILNSFFTSIIARENGTAKDETKGCKNYFIINGIKSLPDIVYILIFLHENFYFKKKVLSTKIFHLELL